MVELEDAARLWEQAVQEEMGIRIEVADTTQCTPMKNLLYKARQEADKPEYHEFVISTPSALPNEIWICRKAVDLT